MIKYDSHDIEILSKTIYAEARGEPPEGQIAVAWVVINRVLQSKGRKQFGNGTVASACLAPWQFSCWNMNDPNRKTISEMQPDDKRLSNFVEIARNVLDGKTPDNTNGATFYYRNGSKKPDWAKGETPCAVIGNHLFFAGIA